MAGQVDVGSRGSGTPTASGVACPGSSIRPLSASKYPAAALTSALANGSGGTSSRGGSATAARIGTWAARPCYGPGHAKHPASHAARAIPPYPAQRHNAISHGFPHYLPPIYIA
jgi:hypothetical protein